MNSSSKYLFYIVCSFDHLLNLYYEVSSLLKQFIFWVQPWEIIGNNTERVAVPRNSVILMWSRRAALKFTLTLKRRPSFTSYLLRFPVVVLSFMAILIFCLPPERPDRHMFGKQNKHLLFYLYFVVLNTTKKPNSWNVVSWWKIYSHGKIQSYLPKTAIIANMIYCSWGVKGIFICYLRKCINIINLL